MVLGKNQSTEQFNSAGKPWKHTMLMFNIIVWNLLIFVFNLSDIATGWEGF